PVGRLCRRGRRGAGGDPETVAGDPRAASLLTRGGGGDVVAYNPTHGFTAGPPAAGNDRGARRGRPLVRPEPGEPAGAAPRSLTSDAERGSWVESCDSVSRWAAACRWARSAARR